jgi:hypothetical protein
MQLDLFREIIVNNLAGGGGQMLYLEQIFLKCVLIVLGNQLMVNRSGNHGRISNNIRINKGSC